MATKYRVQGPDGAVHVFEGPDDATPAQVESFAAQTFAPATPVSSSGIPAPRQGVDQFGIPVTVRPTEKEAPLTLREKISGAVETPVALAANLVSGPITYLAGAGGPEFQRSVASQIQYQPRTRIAQQALESVGQGLEATKLPPFMPMIGGATNALAPATRAIGDVARSEGSLISGSVNQMVAKRATQSDIALANKKFASANSPVIEGAQAANRIGLAVDPVVTNPTIRNKLKSAAVGPAFAEEAVPYNAAQTTKVVREDLGLLPQGRLDANAVELALDKAGKPYDVVAAMPSLTPSEGVVKSMKSLKIPELIADEGASLKVNGIIDKAIDQINEGRSGELIIKDIRQLRRQAQGTYKARDTGGNPAAADVAAADARMGLANVLESLIDENAPNPKVLADIQAARVRMAQIYDHSRAINYANGTVDPQVYARLLDEKQGKMTGVGADIGKAAATFPNIVTTTVPSARELPKLTRAGIAGAAGWTIGNKLAGVPGGLTGMAIMGGAENATTRALARGMVKPEYQTARALPKEYKNKLAPASSKTNALAQ